MQRFRVFAIGALVKSATETFVRQERTFLRGSPKFTLIEQGDGEALRGALKEFAFRHAYQHRSVLRVELQGYNVLRSLMSMLWAGIIDREEAKDVGSKRVTPFTRYVYGSISENYRRVFEHPPPAAKKLPIRYRECLLLTDMISGMTDSFAMDLYTELSRLAGEFRSEVFLEKRS